MTITDMEIFKFASYDIAETIICGQLLKFNNPSFFNDPFDCDINLLEFDFDDISSEVQKDLKTLRSQFGSKLPEDLLREAYISSQKQKIDRSSICCFSMKYNNTIMWSHYADNHKGVCLIFDYSHPDPFESVPSDKLTSFPIIYDNGEKFNYFKSKKEGIHKLFGTKSPDWSYESEYRIILLGQQGLIKFRKELLTGLIFGMRVQRDQIDRMISICERFGYKGLKFGQIVKDGLRMHLKDLSRTIK